MPRKTKINLKEALLNETAEEYPVIDADRKDFLDYGISVATSRAIPNVLDGLKPIQRYILIAMRDLKLNSKAETKKSQTIEGNVMGNYSPHSGSYESIDYLTQDYVFHLPPVYGWGSFSSISGDKAGAARYTEIRNTVYGDMYIDKTSKYLVPYTLNYTSEIEIPEVLAVSFPALLINGVKTGIAVGFTSAIAPHNPVDAISLVIEYLKNPSLSLKDAIEIIKGPDLPTGGVLIGDPYEYYSTGEGKFINQGVIVDSDDPKEKDIMVITHVPYNMGGKGVKTLIYKITDMIAENKLPGIKKIEKYTDDKNMRLEVTLQKDFSHDEARSMLFAKTDLQQTYSLYWKALDGKTPKTFTLLEYLETYAAYQHTLTIHEFKRELSKATQRLNIVDGLITVPQKLNEIIYAAKNTTGRKELEEVLTNAKSLDSIPEFHYNAEQAEVIAGTPIYKLNKVDAQSLVNEQKELQSKVFWANKYIHEPELRDQLIIDRHLKIQEFLKTQGFGKRKTTLLDKSALKNTVYTASDVTTPLTISIDKYNYIKTTDQLKSSTKSNDDYLLRLDTDSNDILCVFSENGEMYQLETSKLRKLSTRDKSNGDNVYSVFNKNGLKSTDKVVGYAFRSQLDDPNTELMIISKNGLAKRISTQGSSLITKTMRSKVTAYKPKTNDKIMYLAIYDGSTIDSKDVIAFTEDKAKRIHANEIKYQHSTAGAGSQTFKSKDNATIKIAYLIDSTIPQLIVNFEGQDLDLMAQPVLKPTQVFKNINFSIIKPNEESSTNDNTDSTNLSD